MRTAAECLSMAAELSRRADLIDDPEIAGSFRITAAKWLDIARLAERQDTGRLSDWGGWHRIR